jgi:hypothetical protein
MYPLALILCFTPALAADSNQTPYRVNAGRDLAISALVGLVSGLPRANANELLTPWCGLDCDRRDVGAFDRSAIGNQSQTAGTVSDITYVGAMALPHALGALDIAASRPEDGWTGYGTDTVVAAIEMSGIAREVHLIARRGLTGDKILQDKVTSSDVKVWPHHNPIEIHGDERVDGLTIADLAGGPERLLTVDGVFIEIGLYPNSGFAVDLVETNEIGEIIVDRRGRTGARGVFAAGDVTDIHDKQIVIAAGAGATAALSAFEYIASQV